MSGIDVKGTNWLQTLSTFISGRLGVGALYVARFEYDIADVLNRPVGAHGVGIVIPAYSLIVGGFFDVNTVFTSTGGNGTIAISVEGANDIQTAASIAGAPYSTIGRKAIVPKANTPESTSVKVGAANKEITCTVAVNAMLTGKLTGYLYYLAGSPSA